MKLYYSPGACSLSPHIVLAESGLDYEIERVDLKTKTTASGTDFRTINPKGYVPALVLDDGQLLTEGPAVVQYLADRVPERELAPAAGTMARYRLQEWLNFIATELHKTFSPLFHEAADETKAAARAALEQRFDWLAAQLGEQPYLLGDRFSVADAYLFTVLGWARYVKLSLEPWPALRAYLERVGARPAVGRAMQEEGLRR